MLPIFACLPVLNRYDSSFRYLAAPHCWRFHAHQLKIEAHRLSQATFELSIRIGSRYFMSQLIPKSPPLIIGNFCGRCGSDLLAQDNFCRHCGTQAATSAIAHRESRNQQLSTPADTIQTVLNNRLYVVLVIALIGPLGLPALWFSPRFSKPTKIVVTSIYVIMTTVVPLAVAWYFLDYSMRPLVEAFKG